MKKIIDLLTVVIIIGLTSCGGGNEKAKELLSRLLKIVGIPQDIIVNICQDDNDNGFCDAIELDNITFIKNNFFTKIFLGSDGTYELQNYDPNKKIIMELQDKVNIEQNDGNFSLEYKGTSQELSILQAMVDADHLKDDDVENIKIMEGKDTFDEVLLKSMLLNLNNYLKNSMQVRNAMEANLQELGRVFIDDLPIKQLPARIEEYCKGDTTCIKETIENFHVNLDTDEQDIYTIAQAKRVQKLLNDKLLETFQCNENELRTIKHYGIEDIFNLANGRELTRPSPNVLARVNREQIVHYDESRMNSIFAEDVRKLPMRMRKGKLFIGLKKDDELLNDGDRIFIGQYGSDNFFSSTLRTLHEKNGWLHQTINNNTPTTDIYFNDFKNIVLSEKGTLLDYLTIKNHFDVVVEKNTAVDFITVATCSKKDPRAEIQVMLNAFECPTGSRLVQIAGGTADAFDIESEKPATPSEILLSRIDKSFIDYDQEAHNKFFAETLNLPNEPTITQAQFSVGLKPMEKFLYQNDTIHIGNYEMDEYARFKLYGNDENSIFNQWTRGMIISNGERVYQTNLADINLTNGTGSLFELIQSNNRLLDIVIQNDTIVDFTYLNLCFKNE